jgi:hypothetical protein
MLEVIEKLLVLQDRDRKIIQIQGELARIGPESSDFRTREALAQKALDDAKQRVKQIESERKRLEIEVEGKKEQINRYANQQLQTRKNEEYRALANEIETCKKAIVQIEDQELELMEQAEQANKVVQKASQEAQATKKLVDDQLAQLKSREENLKKEIEGIEAEREKLASEIDESDRYKYERLLKQRGATVVVGVEHGVCGGCHMKLQTHILVACQQDQEIVHCPNCSRILYYTRDMALAGAD